jgi:hypothetical protein
MWVQFLPEVPFKNGLQLDFIERRTPKAKVAGENPARPTKFIAS